jgi:amidase
VWSVTAEDLQAVASRHNVKIPVEAEEHYLYLLNSLDATSKQIFDLPEYIDPRLKPDEDTLPRNYKKAEKNPLNAWSHLVGGLQTIVHRDRK